MHGHKIARPVYVQMPGPDRRYIQMFGRGERPMLSIDVLKLMIRSAIVRGRAYSDRPVYDIINRVLLLYGRWNNLPK